MNIFLPILSVNFHSGFQVLEGGTHHDTSKHAAERSDLQKKGRVKSRGNTIFCSLPTYFLFQWFSLKPRPGRGDVTVVVWFGFVWVFSFSDY